MVQRVFSDSQFRFTDPVRFFKENDPIYWALENVPLKQLQENDNWLKDQIANINVEEIGRDGFAELKPYVNGNDNIVRVKPGRFTARINDAYSLTPLQVISNLIGFELREFNTWAAATLSNTLLQPTIQKFQSTLQADALNMNGLAERAFARPAREPDLASQFSRSDQPTVVNLTGIMRQPYPIVESQLWRNDTVAQTYVIRQYDPTNPVVGFATMGVAETAFIKRWRGIGRTAVVDVAQEETIEIPPFDSQDFYYINENGQKTLLNASQRVDLVFMYSKPIDVSSTTIAKFVNNRPSTITRPILGIVKGAGIGVDFSRVSNSVNSNLPTTSAITSDGYIKILPSVADENGENLGFTASSIKGSFPSPDDLMNLAPQLCENLASDHYALIGQSILPIAYVVVRRTAGTNEVGTTIITDSDLVDIRPFFRTTELSYNERAGLAAAVPAPSLANPVATQAEVDFEVKRVYNDLNSRLLSIQNNTGENSTPRVVGAGYLKGGYNFGVEGALARYIDTRISGGLSKERLKGEVRNRYGLPLELTIPDYPDWDIAEWVSRNNLTSPGSYPNDYVNIHQFGRTETQRNSSTYEFAPYADNELTRRLEKLGTDNSYGQDGMVHIYYVKKTINIDRNSVPWMRDYHVNAQLWNCLPMSCRAAGNNSFQAAGSNAVWIEKKFNSFTIYVAWVANDFFANQGISNDSERPMVPNLGRTDYMNMPLVREGRWVAGFLVMNSDLITASYSDAQFPGESNAGVAIYPSVTFQVTGFPSSYDGLQLDLNTFNPTITLR